jgi:hypothetical protein
VWSQYLENETNNFTCNTSKIVSTALFLFTIKFNKLLANQRMLIKSKTVEKLFYYLLRWNGLYLFRVFMKRLKIWTPLVFLWKSI